MENLGLATETNDDSNSFSGVDVPDLGESK